MFGTVNGTIIYIDFAKFPRIIGYLKYTYISRSSRIRDLLLFRVKLIDYGLIKYILSEPKTTNRESNLLEKY